MDILYYSNYCPHSQKVLQTLVKGNLSDKISFICIDKRQTDNKNGQTYVHLENGGKVVLPPNVQSVPSLLLVKENYRIVCGDEILRFYHKDLKSQSDVATNHNGEPSSYQLMKANGGTNVTSEQYTLYDMSPDELSAKGNGGNRQLHNYVPVSNNMNLIPTPDDTYKPDKVSNDVTVDSLQQRRMDEINEIMPNKQPFGQQVS
jgi:hypothetical protein|tara:strand:+ start:672 stop:1280 length:609 start_codon:yes stop_codon:yes gene_type:complete